MAKEFNWILIRGLAREIGHWRDFPEKMEERLGGKVHCLELAGMGQRSSEASFLTIRENVLDLRKQFKKNNLDELPCAALGISMGGMVLLEWAARFPKDFEKVVLVNTSASNYSLPIDRMRPEGMKFILKLIGERDVLKREEQVIKFMGNLEGEQAAGIAFEFSQLDRANPLQLKNVTKQIFASARFKAAEKVDTDLLFLIGNRDKLVNPNCSLKLASQYLCPVKVHEGGGHDLVLQDPEWVLEKIEKWLIEDVNDQGEE